MHSSLYSMQPELAPTLPCFNGLDYFWNAIPPVKAGWGVSMFCSHPRSISPAGSEQDRREVMATQADVAGATLSRNRVVGIALGCFSRVGQIYSILTHLEPVNSVSSPSSSSAYPVACDKAAGEFFLPRLRVAQPDRGRITFSRRIMHLQRNSRAADRFRHQWEVAPAFGRLTPASSWWTISPGRRDSTRQAASSGLLLPMLKPIVEPRFKLRHGPYVAPPLRRGDRATCLVRDCDVIITSWTAAPIPWPRCRAMGTRGGGSGILVDEELAWAVRTESAAAIGCWWGANVRAVAWWRRALGVTRTNNPSSHLLIQCAAEVGGAASAARGLTEEEAGRRSETAIRLNLGQYLTPGGGRPLWSQAELRLLGTMPDDEVARRIGNTAEAVRVKRSRLYIPNPVDRRRKDVSADRIIARRSFTDGSTRDVFADADGQFVLGDDGEKVRGVWLLTDQDEGADVPAVVYAPSPSNRDG